MFECKIYTNVYNSPTSPLKDTGERNGNDGSTRRQRNTPTDHMYGSSNRGMDVTIHLHLQGVTRVIKESVS